MLRRKVLRLATALGFVISSAAVAQDATTPPPAAPPAPVPSDVVVGQPDFKTYAPRTDQTGMRGPQGVWTKNPAAEKTARVASAINWWSGKMFPFAIGACLIILLFDVYRIIRVSRKSPPSALLNAVHAATP